MADKKGLQFWWPNSSSRTFENSRLQRSFYNKSLPSWNENQIIKFLLIRSLAWVQGTYHHPKFHEKWGKRIEQNCIIHRQSAKHLKLKQDTPLLSLLSTSHTETTTHWFALIKLIHTFLPQSQRINLFVNLLTHDINKKIVAQLLSSVLYIEIFYFISTSIIMSVSNHLY